MLLEESSKLPLTDAQPRRECLDIGFIEPTKIDEREGARHGVRGATPRREVRRGFRPAPQARAKAGFVRRRGRWKELDVFALRCPRRTHRAAVDARRANANEQPSVETRVTRRQRAIAGARVQVHVVIVTAGRAAV